MMSRCMTLFFLLLYINCVNTYNLCNTVAPEKPSIYSELHFTKDMNEDDFVKTDEYIALPCCAAGYDNITWLKDGILIDFNTEESHLTFDNQTLEIQRARIGHAGNYSCEVRNKTHVITHHIRLRVFVDNQYKGPPVFTTIPRNTWAEVGESIKIDCAAFLGFHRSSTSQLCWLKKIKSNSKKYTRYVLAGKNGSSIFINNTYWGYNSVISVSSLLSAKVTKEVFGEYICVANNGYGSTLNYTVHLRRGVDPSAKTRYSYTPGLIGLSVVILVCTLTTSLYIKYKIEIHLYLKDRFGQLDDPESRLYDVFLCYSVKDTTELILLKWIVPKVEALGYQVFVFERDAEIGAWMPDAYLQTIRTSRRFLLVLTTSLLEDNWCRFACQIAVEQSLGPLGLGIICLLPAKEEKQTSELLESCDAYESLRPIVNVASKIYMPPPQATPRQLNNFWKKLRLKLPPMRPSWQRKNDTNLLTAF